MYVQTTMMKRKTGKSCAEEGANAGVWKMKGKDIVEEIEHPRPRP